MKQIGTSSLWTERYRPKNFEDVIATDEFHRFLQSVKSNGEIGNLIFNGPAGCGKTTFAKVIINELGADDLYINASKDNSIDDVRYKVQGFATTKSLMSDGLKIVIFDEFDRLSANAMDALKAMIEETHTQCRYIFITNNINRIIDPLLSRTEIFTFGNEIGDAKNGLIVKYFSRAKFILENEGVEYDKKSLALVVKEMYPDFRRVLNTLQKYVKLYGKIDKGVMNTMDDTLAKDLLTELKSRNWDKVQLMARSLDPGQFYRYFYNEMREQLKTECIPDIVIILSEYNYRDAMVVDREINLVACLTELMKAVKWKT